MKKNIVYVRKSLEELQKNSIEMQISIAKEKARRLGAVIHEEYIDSGVSARSIDMYNRPALKKLLDDIKNDKVNKVFVYKRDRLARIAVEYLEIIEIIERHGVDLVFTCSEEPPIAPGPSGKFLEYIYAGIIQNEGNCIVKRIKEAQRTKFLAGSWLGTLPYGYSYINNSCIQNPDEAEVVKKIYDDYVNNIEVEQIVSRINEKGLKHHGKEWTCQRVMAILKNPIYKGLRTFGNDLVKEFDFLKIIDEQTWEKSQLRMRTSRRANLPKKVTSNTSPPQPFILEGKLICGECCNPFKTKVCNQKDKQRQFYTCNNRSKHANNKTYNISKDAVESLVMKEINNYFTNVQNTNINRIIELSRKNIMNKIASCVSKYKRDVEVLVKRRKKLVGQLLQEKDNHQVDDMLKKDIEYIETAIERLQKAQEIQAERFTKALEYLENVQACIAILERHKSDDYFNRDEQLNIIHSFIQEINVQGEIVDICFKYPFKGVLEIG